MENNEVAKQAIDKLANGAELVYTDFKQVVEFAKEKGWDVLIRQQVIEGWLTILVPLILLAMFVTATLIFNKKLSYWSKKQRIANNKGHYSRKDKAREKVDFWGGLTVISLIVSIVSLIVTCVLVPMGTMRICNPEYYAAIQACRMVTGKDCGGN